MTRGVAPTVLAHHTLGTLSITEYDDARAVMEYDPAVRLIVTTEYDLCPVCVPGVTIRREAGVITAIEPSHDLSCPNLGKPQRATDTRVQ
jgi:hypothetical protein